MLWVIDWIWIGKCTGVSREAFVRWSSTACSQVIEPFGNSDTHMTTLGDVSSLKSTFPWCLIGFTIYFTRFYKGRQLVIS